MADLRADFVASLWRGTKEISLQELGDTYARLEKTLELGLIGKV